MRWVEPSPQPWTQEILAAADGNELLASLLWDRGFRTQADAREFLDPAEYQPASAAELPGMAEAVRMISEAIQREDLIGVWGDFDVDGQTATTVLVSALRQLGGRVDYHIPVRAKESHGIRVPQLREFLDGGVDLLLTCDTGIAEFDGIRFAREHGVKVVITDHHDLPPALPEAEAIINPKLLPADHPLAQLPGVGVAYKLVEGLFTAFEREGEAAQFLDLVALGIVADVAEVRADTRYLLQRGLEALRQAERLGLRLLCDLSKIEQAFITEEDIGFGIAPRLNALGRLGDANPMVEFLTTEDESIAMVRAHQLDGLNAKRKTDSEHVYRAVLERIETQPDLQASLALVVAGEQWPGGVVGLAAGRLASRFYKPAIVLTRKDGDILSGSARSVKGVDISEAIRACSDLLTNFGGHPMAAGLSLREADLPAFRRRLDRAIQEQTGGILPEPELVIDDFVDLSELDLSLVLGLDKLAPYGPGNPRPVFGVQDLKMVSHSFLGRNKDHRQLIVEDIDGERQKVVWWQSAEEDLPVEQFDLALTAGINRFRGDASLQLILVDLREQAGSGGQAAQEDKGLEVIDLRRKESPADALAELAGSPQGVVIWGEGLEKLPDGAVSRMDLVRGPALALWSLPPSYSVLARILTRVAPERVYVFGEGLGIDKQKVFLEKLAGVLKFVAANRNGRISVSEIASRLGVSEGLVVSGTQWLEAKGMFSVEMKKKNLSSIKVPGSGIEDQQAAAALELEISKAWKEIQAFRDYFKNCDSDELKSLVSS